MGIFSSLSDLDEDEPVSADIEGRSLEDIVEETVASFAPENTTLKARLKRGLARVAEASEPVSRVVAKVAEVAVHLEKPSVLGVAGLAGTALTEIHRMISDEPEYSHVVSIVPTQLILDRARELGARPIVEAGGDPQTRLFGLNGLILGDWKSHLVTNVPMDKLVPLIKSFARGNLPRVCNVSISERYPVLTPGELHAMPSEFASKVVAQIEPTLRFGHRSILLNGRPGVGKTVMMQYIADRFGGDGPILWMDNAFISVSSSGFDPSMLQNAVAMCDPKVILVDEIDKVAADVRKMDALKAACPLVIYASNNAEYEQVMDASVMRAGRIDEMFTVTDGVIPTIVRPPFDVLPDEVWEEVRGWPASFLTEISIRLRSRGLEGLRLDDLRDRFDRKTRSRTDFVGGGAIFAAEEDDL
jgi:hypothetical protein